MNTASKTPDARTDKPALQTALYALLIGASAFDADIRQLPFVAKDVPAFKARLLALGFPESAITVVGPGGALEATRDGVENAISAFSRTIQDESRPSQVIVYVASHGIRMREGNDTYLIWRDTVIDSRYLQGDFLLTIPEKSTSAGELVKRVASLKACQKLLLFDACFAGAAQREQLPYPIAPRHAHAERAKCVTQVISASGAAEYAFESALIGHGFLTYSINEQLDWFLGLEGGTLSASSLYRMVAHRVAMACRPDFPQTPRCWKYDTDGEFVFIHPAGPGSNEVARWIHNEEDRLKGFVSARLASSDAEIAEKEGKWDEAAEFWNTAAIQDPQHPQYRTRRERAIRRKAREAALADVRDKVRRYAKDAIDILENVAPAHAIDRASLRIESAVKLGDEHDLPAPPELSQAMRRLDRMKSGIAAESWRSAILRLEEEGNIEECLHQIEMARARLSQERWLQACEQRVRRKKNEIEGAEADTAKEAIQNAILVGDWSLATDLTGRLGAKFGQRVDRFIDRFELWRELRTNGNIRSALLCESSKDYKGALVCWRNALHAAPDYPGLKMLFDACRDRIPRDEPRHATNPRDGLEYVRVEPGAIFAGPVPDDPDSGTDEGPRRLVQITVPFWISVTPVTAEAFGRVMEEERFVREPFLPMTGVSQQEASRYTDRVGRARAGRGALPTQDQWEFAARSGEDGLRYPWPANEVPDGVWYGGRQPHPVGHSWKNAFGLEDVAGNVWEWCADEPAFTRGGGFDSPIRDLRVSARRKVRIDIGYPNVGFRCVINGDLPER